VIAVVGAGFAGLAVARALAPRHEVTVLEEDREVGYPPHCTGIVSEYVVSALGRPARETVQAAYEYVIIRAPGAALEIKTRDRVFKLDRVTLEKLMLEDIESLGARVLLGVKATRVAADGRIAYGGETLQASLVVLAEGWRRRLLRSLGIEHRPMQSYGVNIQGKLPPSKRIDTITVYFNSRVYGAGFGWALPLDSGEHVVGALSFDPRAAAPAAEKLARTLDMTPKARYGGVVVHGPPLPVNPHGRVLAVGDAAALNKPVTGGGLYPNTLLAQLLSVEHPERAYRTVASRLRRQYRVARALYAAPEAAEEIARAASRSGLAGVVSGRIGYDEHESLVGLALSSPLKSLSALVRLVVGNPRIALAVLRGLLVG